MDLYRRAASFDALQISVEQLRRIVETDHETVEKVEFWACDLDPAISRGHMVLELDRSSPYDDPYISASVRFDKTLNVCWSRFVCCKELMHVFDSSLEKTSNRHRFIQLMNELESNPLAVDQSPMFASERNAEWMALVCLCPIGLRNSYREKYNTGEYSEYDIALRLRIPIDYIKLLMSDRYDRNLELLTGVINRPRRRRRAVWPKPEALGSEN